MIFRYTVAVDADTREHADQVMSERLGFDEAYADENNLPIEYGLDWRYEATTVRTLDEDERNRKGE